MKMIHELLSDAQESGGLRGLRAHLALRGDLADLGETIARLRMLQALDCGARHYAVFRSLQFAVRRPLEELLDDLALRSGLAAVRLDAGTLLLDGAGAFVRAAGRRKSDYTSGTFDIWAETPPRLAAVRAALLAIVDEHGVREERFTIDWHFWSAHMGLSNVAFEEIADPPLLDEAYPGIGEGVAPFTDRYLDARDTVLVLQGPPGTGKTRLVRAILGALTRRKGESARVLYTADRRTLENDEIFVDFLTGTHDAFVVEDADHLLGARAHGNTDLHRFLTAADGIVRAQGRKIIFTTNLPNIGDIDDALLRPGRCFATLRTRTLERMEIAALLQRLLPDAAGRDAVLTALLPAGAKTASLAQVYRAVEF